MGGDRCALWLQGHLHPVLRDGRGVGSGRPMNGVTRNHSSETFLSSDTNLRKKKKSVEIHLKTFLLPRSF